MRASRWLRGQVLVGCIFAVALGAQADMKNQQISEDAAAAAAGLGDDLEASAMTVTQLRCEYLENPLGINVTVPRLSWWLETDERAQKGCAYHILVASTPELLAEDQGDLWDTGKWQSDQSHQIEYAGLRLEYGMRAYWKVRVWDAQGRPSAWSAPARWTMGPIAAQDWKAQWIGMNPKEGDPDFPWIRGTVHLNGPVKQALAYVNALGYYELYINGQRVDDHVLSPAVSQLSERSYYITHDVSASLKPGANVIALWLGQGWYSPSVHWTQHEGPVVRAQIDYVLEDDTTMQLFTDASWKAQESPIAQVGRWMSRGSFGGEAYDARKENAAWNTLDSDYMGDAAIAEAAVAEDMPDSQVSFSVEASSIQKNYVPDRTVDDDRATFWVSSSGPSEDKPEWLLLKLARSTEISGLIVQGREGHGPRQCSIQRSMDGKVFETITEISLEDGERKNISFSKQEAKFIRLHITSAYDRVSPEAPTNVQVVEIGLPGVTMDHLNDRIWKDVVLCDIQEHLTVTQPVEPNRIIETIQPQAIEEIEPDVYRIDFGRNLTGWLEAELPSVTTAGQQVTFRYFDQLIDGAWEDDGLKYFNQRDIYTARDGASQRFANRMNYHAFQYVHITGLTEAPSLGDFKAHLIHTDYDLNASFECSSERLTKIHDMIAYTLRCLSLGGYIVDCAHRERLGYGGDGLSSTETALTLFGMAPLYTAWLDHWADCQRANGDMPHVAPQPCNAGGGPYWCGFIIHAAWEMYLQEGDRRVLETHYDSMRRWLSFVESHTKDGLLRPWPNEPYRNWYLADWAVPKGIDQKHPESIDLVNNCFIISCYERMSEIAHVMGRTRDAQDYTAKAEVMRPRTHAAFYNETTGSYADGDQIDMAYPLLTDVVPEAMREAMLDKLVHNIMVERNARHSVGLVGVPILYRTLAKYDRNDVVMAYTDHDRSPGYGYMLAQGASTVWEYWESEYPSSIHNCFNGFGAWFYRSVAGINPDPDDAGYKNIIIAPKPVPGLDWAKARQVTPHGPVDVHWQKTAESFTINVSIPPGATATLYLPATEKAVVTEAGSGIHEVEGVALIGYKKGCAILQLSSGSYSVQAAE